MKNFKHILVLFVLIGSVSCDEFLDTPPASQLSIDAFWNTAQDAQLGVAALYNEVQVTFEQSFWSWGELRGDNYIYNDRPSADVQQTVGNTLTVTTDGGDWTELYAAIAHANVAIENIPLIDPFTGQDDLLAQVYALRSLMYFYAVRIWGDVPKITSIDSDLSGVGRSPVSEIYNEIILPDLDLAESMISTNRSQNYISRGAILALKAHIYAWPGAHQSYQTVVDAVTELEALGYSLETAESGWLDMFQSESNTEIIFWLSWNFAEDGNNGGHARFQGATPNIVPPVGVGTIEEKWIDAFPDDFRRLNSMTFDRDIGLPPGTPGEFNFLRVVNKFIPAPADRTELTENTQNNEYDIPFFRLSGLLLLQAEAENYLDNRSNAIDLVNRIRTARGNPTVTLGVDVADDQTAVRDLILDERQFELIAEGQRFWDLVRNGVAISTMSNVTDFLGNPNGLTSEDKILWPISQNVLNRNPSITQNPGYN